MTSNASSNCQLTTNSVAQLVFNEKNCDIIVKIGQYAGVSALLALALTNKPLYHTIHGAASENFWQMMCKSAFSNRRDEYSILFDYSDDVYFMMPNVVCPDTHREFYFSCIRKIKWLSHIKRNISHSFVQYLESYRSSNSRNFGASRLFSTVSPVYIVHSDESTVTMSYSDIEAFVRCNGSSRVEKSDPNGLTIYIYSNKFGTVKIAAIHRLNDTNITFADVGHAVCSLSDSVIQAFKPHQFTIEMPYEVYYIN